MNIKVNAVTVRKEKRTFAGIGKKQYEFDLQKEKDIYSYMQGMRVKKPKKLEEKLKFDSYCEWKKYVQNKYNGYDSKKLLGFSRYLKQGIRNVKPSKEYWNYFIPVLITLGVTKLFEVILKTKNIFADIPFLTGLLVYVIFMAMLFFFSVIFIIYILGPVFDNDTEENMFTDYKETIDEMLSQKSKQEKKENKKKKMRKK